MLEGVGKRKLLVVLQQLCRTNALVRVRGIILFRADKRAFAHSAKSKTFDFSLVKFRLPHRQQPWRPAATRRRTASPDVRSSPLVCTYLLSPKATERELAPLHVWDTTVNGMLGILS